MFSGHRKEEKPFSGPDSGKKTPKPAPAPKAQAPRKSFFSLTGGPGVIQRIKLNGADVNLDDPTVFAQLKAALLQTPAFSKKFMQNFEGKGPSQVAEKWLRRVLPALKESTRDCKNFNELAYSAALAIISQHQQAGQPERERERERLRFAYTVGGTPGSFDAEDLRALQADRLLGEIRRVQNAPPLDRREIDMKDKGLRYTDFYSRSAMREEVTRRLIELSPKTQQGDGREDRIYTPVFGGKGSAPDYEAAYSSATFHHLEPMSSLTKTYKKDHPCPQQEEPSQQEEVLKWKAELQRFQWQASNLVFGPGRDRRVYEPGDAWDVEADEVFINTETVIAAESSQPVAWPLLGPLRTRVPIRAESSRAAMRTTYLQQFYHDCRLYQQFGDPEQKPDWHAAPQNLIEQANRMLARFSLIEIRHRDRFLLDGLAAFIKVFSQFPEQSPERVGAVKRMIEILLDYGRREDRRNSVRQPSVHVISTSSATTTSSTTTTSSAITFPRVPEEEGPRHPVVRLGTPREARNRPWNAGDRFEIQVPGEPAPRLYRVYNNYMGYPDIENLDARIELRGG